MLEPTNFLLFGQELPRTNQRTAPPAPSIVTALYAKARGELYQVELNYKVNGKFLLRPISGRPYQTLQATAAQVRAMRLFPIFGGA